jgi:hypothetical protein
MLIKLWLLTGVQSVGQTQVIVSTTAHLYEEDWHKKSSIGSSLLINVKVPEKNLVMQYFVSILSWLAPATQIQMRLKTVKPRKAQQGRRSQEECVKRKRGNL